MKESICQAIKEEMMRKRILTVGALSLLALSSMAMPTDKTQNFIEHLDAYFLPPFQKVMDKFGFGRVKPKSRGHAEALSFIPEALAFLDSEGKGRVLAAEASGLKLELRVAMFHLRPLPDSYAKNGLSNFKGNYAQILVESPEPLPPGPRELWKNNPQLLIDFTNQINQKRHEEENLLNDVILFKLNEARSGKNITFSEKGWKFVLRPIRAESVACLSCHTDAKKGETLGALVYMLRNVPAASELK
ncbi:MAG: hypothetical protein NTX57_09975 [Armatimonadetes bacterium]|nr:hypothetical protein [Armatimonadota bacterium]